MPVTNSDRTTYWLEQLEKWRQSGLNQKDYCTLNNLSHSTFWRWKTVLEPSAKNEIDPFAISQSQRPILPSQLIPISVVNETPGQASQDSVSSDSGLRLKVNGKFDIMLSQGFHTATLRQLLDVLTQHD